MPKEKKEDTGEPKKPKTDYQLFCSWMLSDPSVNVHDPNTGEIVPLGDLHFTKRQPYFSGCWAGTLAFPEGGTTIAGLKFTTLPEMKAYFKAKYKALQAQWQKDKAAWKEQNPTMKTKTAASSGDAGPKNKKQKVDGPSSSTPSSATRPASSGDATPRKKQKVDGSASSTPYSAPATAGSSKSRCPPLAEATEEFKRQLNVTGTNIIEVVDAACEALGVSSNGNVEEKAARCWKMIQG